ncbi:MAG: hypothetical protein ACRDLO_05770, partial [Solirubrobacterales bacterium]
MRITTNQTDRQGETMNPRPLARSMRALLWVEIALTFAAGTQLVVLAEHTGRLFAWPIEPPSSALFIGASFWGAAALVLWAARQRDWARAQLALPSLIVVASLLCVATLIHIEQFQSLLGAFWIEVYAFVPPLSVALVAIQFAIPGSDVREPAPLPRWLRAPLAVQAALLLSVGAVLYAAPAELPALWPWALGELTSQAIGTWLLGIATLAILIVARNDRGDLPGASLSNVILGAVLLFGVARFAGDFEFARASTWVYIGFAASAVAVGGSGTLLAWREGRYRPARRPGWIPVEVRTADG